MELHKGAPKSTSVTQTGVQFFSSAVNKYRVELGNKGITAERFASCLMTVAGKPSTEQSLKIRKFSCSLLWKSCWLMFLGSLAFALLVAGFSPLSFIFHKVSCTSSLYLVHNFQLQMIIYNRNINCLFLPCSLSISYPQL